MLWGCFAANFITDRLEPVIKALTTREMDRPGLEGQWNPPQRICGGVRRVVVTEEQRYGPRWLRVNDDDEDVASCKDRTARRQLISSTSSSS